MKRTEIIMGMPVSVEILDSERTSDAVSAEIEHTFDFFREVDARYSTYKSDSEISRINAGLPESQWSDEMKRVLKLCEETRRATDGFFDIKHEGKLDPSGLVKGWAINRAAGQLKKRGFQDFCVEAGGDFQVSGHGSAGGPWRIGIRNPFARREVVKVVTVTTEGVATSGTAVRGQHIYDPHKPGLALQDVASLTVIGPNIYEADRFATAAFAMGLHGIDFIASLDGFEAYLIRADKQAVFTNGFEEYVT